MPLGRLLTIAACSVRRSVTKSRAWPLVCAANIAKMAGPCPACRTMMLSAQSWQRKTTPVQTHPATVLLEACLLPDDLSGLCFFNSLLHQGKQAIQVLIAAHFPAGLGRRLLIWMGCALAGWSRIACRLKQQLCQKGSGAWWRLMVAHRPRLLTFLLAEISVVRSWFVEGRR